MITLRIMRQAVHVACIRAKMILVGEPEGKKALGYDVGGIILKFM
jgi:hypothetical protein